MKRIFFVSLSYSLLLIFNSCGSKEQNNRNAQTADSLPVVEVPLKTVVGYTSYPASIEGTVNSEIRAKVPGYITEVLVGEGEKVKKDQVIFKLETESLTQDAGAANANVNAAEVEVEKLKPLVEKEIISGVQLETAKAKLAQARASYNSIIANIGYSNIKSPVDGYVGSIPHRKGALVSPGDPTPLTTVSAIEEVYAFFAMNESDYLNFIQHTEGENLNEKIEKFPPVKLELANGQIYEEEGNIESVSGQINSTTGTVSFKAVFPNPNRLLTNGNSGSIMIPNTYKDVVVVPEFSSYEQQGFVYVYKVQGDSLAVTAPIVVKDRIDNLIIVESGLEAGEKIVAKGVGKLRNNTAIVPKPIAFDSIANTLDVVFK